MKLPEHGDTFGTMIISVRTVCGKLLVATENEYEDILEMLGLGAIGENVDDVVQVDNTDHPQVLPPEIQPPGIQSLGAQPPGVQHTSQQPQERQRDRPDIRFDDMLNQVTKGALMGSVKERPAQNLGVRLKPPVLNGKTDPEPFFVKLLNYLETYKI